jgi:hypothetical protein
MIARLRQERGMSLPELLITLVIGMTITLAGFTLIEVTMNRSGEIAARVEAVQSGRSGMDTITRQLRSQVCTPWTNDVNAIRRSFESASPNSMTFFVDMRDTSSKTVAETPPAGYVWGPEKHKLTFEPPAPDVYKRTTGRIIEESWRPTSINGAVYQYDKPATTRVVVESVDQATDRLDPTGNTLIPVFQYYRYDFTKATPEPTYAMPGDLNAESIQKIAKIKITYKAQPARKRKDGSATTVFTNDVYVRTVDPNAKTDELSAPCL